MSDDVGNGAAEEPVSDLTLGDVLAEAAAGLPGVTAGTSGQSWRIRWTASWENDITRTHGRPGAGVRSSPNSPSTRASCRSTWPA